MLSVSASDGSVTFSAPGGGTSATVTQADLMSCAGVVHVIDSLMIPGTPGNEPMMTEAPEMVTPEPMPEPTPEPMPVPVPVPEEAPDMADCSSIVELLAGSPDLTTLLAAVDVRLCSLPLHHMLPGHQYRNFSFLAFLKPS